MTVSTLPGLWIARLHVARRSKITQKHTYSRLAETAKEPNNAQVSRHIAADERGHEV